MDTNSANIQQDNYFPLTVGSSWIYNTNIGKATVTILQSKENQEHKIMKFKVSVLSIKEVLIEKENEIICLERKIKALIIKRNISYNPGLVKLRMPLIVGKTWECDGQKTINKKSQQQKSTMTIVTNENIVVPAGEFSCMEVKQESKDEDGSTECFHQWLASGIGAVKMEGTFKMKGVLAIIQKILGCEKLLMELVKYDIK